MHRGSALVSTRQVLGQFCQGIALARCNDARINLGSTLVSGRSVVAK